MRERVGGAREANGHRGGRSAPRTGVVGGGVESSILELQREAGNAAVTQLIVQRLWNRSGKKLRPFSVSNGTGPGQNLKWNKGSRGVGGKKQFNTGFWCLTDDWRDQLHVHMGGAGGLTESGGAHHWKYGDTYGMTASEADLETVFGSRNVTTWTKSEYLIP